jgi:predicted nucleic acid-binding protein
MTLIDTGPLVALFDPRDASHARCKRVLQGLSGRLFTTVSVLTEAFHMLEPASRGADNLRLFILGGGAAALDLGDATLSRAFELMETYRDHPMDLADASLVALAEALRTRRVFTLDRRDFETYRVRIGRRNEKLQIVT